MVEKGYFQSSRITPQKPVLLSWSCLGRLIDERFVLKCQTFRMSRTPTYHPYALVLQTASDFRTGVSVREYFRVSLWLGLALGLRFGYCLTNSCCYCCHLVNAVKMCNLSYYYSLGVKRGAETKIDGKCRLSRTENSRFLVNICV